MGIKTHVRSLGSFGPSGIGGPSLKNWDSTNTSCRGQVGIAQRKVSLRVYRCSPLLRYGENSEDSTHAKPHCGTSCRYQIFF
jgi:hypothetical protein